MAFRANPSGAPPATGFNRLLKQKKEPRRALSEVGRARSIRARQTSGIRRSSYVGATLSMIYTDLPRCGKSYFVFTAFLADQLE